MRCLLPSLFILVTGCASDYRFLKPILPDTPCDGKAIAPHLVTSWYDASIDIAGHHLSGLVLIKNMPDSSQRVVFTNEAGITFFDFGFAAGGIFDVHSVVSQLNKKPIVETLKKDFQLILGVPFRSHVLQRWGTADELFFGVVHQNEVAYFIAGKDCKTLHRLEWGTQRKRKVSVRIPGKGYPLPDTLEIVHYDFPLKITLTHFPKNDSAQ